MADMMTFPDTWEEYEKVYGLTDTEQIYTNGARLIPSFRAKQWLDHIEAERSEDERLKEQVKSFIGIVDQTEGNAETNASLL